MAADPYATMHASIKAFASAELTSLGLGANDTGRKVIVPGMGRSQADTRGVWSLKSRRACVSTREVLISNVRIEMRMPENVEIRSDFQELRYLAANFPLSEMRQLLLRGCNTDGTSFDFLPEQLAAMVSLSRGALPSNVRVSVLNGPGQPGYAYDVEYSRVEDPSAVPSFLWVVSPMGSGKTLMSLMAAFKVARFGWDDCKSRFRTWSNAARVLDPLIPAGVNRTGSPLKLARAMFVVADANTYMQWLAVIRANLPALQQLSGAVQLRVWPGASRSMLAPGETLEALSAEEGDDTITIVVMGYASAKRAAKKEKPADKKGKRPARESSPGSDSEEVAEKRRRAASRAAAAKRARASGSRKGAAGGEEQARNACALYISLCCKHLYR